MTIPLQINGKTKGILKIAVGTDKETILEKGKEILGRKLSAEPVKEIYVPGKIVNFVVKNDGIIMMNFFRNKKTRQIVVGILAAILLIAMILTMLPSSALPF